MRHVETNTETLPRPINQCFENVNIFLSCWFTLVKTYSQQSGLCLVIWDQGQETNLWTIILNMPRQSWEAYINMFINYWHFQNINILVSVKSWSKHISAIEYRVLTSVHQHVKKIFSFSKHWYLSLDLKNIETSIPKRKVWKRRK